VAIPRDVPESRRKNQIDMTSHQLSKCRLGALGELEEQGGIFHLIV